MSGLSDYRVYNHSSAVNARNFGLGRPRVIGTLVHSTGGLNSLSWLTTGSAVNGTPASADCLVTREGTRYELGASGRFPYHAGKSSWQYDGKIYVGDQVSRQLLGVELENLDTQWCTWQQLDSLAEYIVLRGLDFGWQWPYYVVGHYEVARPLARRSDPQGFAWGDFMGRLYARARAANVAGL